MAASQSNGSPRQHPGNGWRSSILAGLLVWVCFSAFANEMLGTDPENAFSVHGFGSLGAVRSNTDQVEFVRDISQPRGARREWDARPDSIFGLQTNWRVTPGLEVVAQAVSKYRFDQSFDPEINWLFLEYDPLPYLSLRGGRLGTEFFMLADSRHVGYSYLPVRPPGDYFWYLPFFSINGVDAALSIPIGEALFRGKVFYGLANGKIPLAQRQWRIDDSPMMGGYLEAHWHSWQLRASYANIHFAHDLPIDEALATSNAPTSARSFLEARGTRSDYFSLGAVYDAGPWQLQLMVNHIDQGSHAFESSTGGYVLGGYRIGEVTPYIGYSRVRSQPKSYPGSDPQIDTIMAVSRAVQRTSMLGLRWDLARNVALKGQWDAIRADSASLFPYRNDPASGQWSGKANIFSMTLDFIF